jgi:uncharacterized protein YjbI with pentapeptide repeats
VAKCAYRGERIREIEEKWIDENVEDEEERMRKKSFLSNLLGKLGGDVDCRLDAIPGGEFCIFHDPNYWREHPGEVRNEFHKRLKESKEGFFIGFHLPRIELPKVVENNLRTELVKFHDTLEAFSTKFEGPVYFDGATFLGKTDFPWATFKRLASFVLTTFMEPVSFFNAKFLEITWFDGATFKEMATFEGTTFKEMVLFSNTKCLGETSFENATFKKRARFDFAKFYGRTCFTMAKFKESATFHRTKFFRETLFNGSVFSGLAGFKDSVFLPDLLEECLDLDNYISFSSVDFGESGRVVFDGCRMGRLSFIYTDVRRLIFRNVDWGEDFRIFDDKLFLIKIGKERESFLRECREKLEIILDVLEGKKVDKEVEREIKLGKPEILQLLMELRELRKKKGVSMEDKKRLEELEEKLKGPRSKIKEKLDDLRDSEKINAIFKKVVIDRDLTLDNVLAVYRGLRDNYDYHLKYEESGRFFINEMRLRRVVGKRYGGEKLHGLEGVKLKLSDIVERGVMWAYEMLSLYGESYTRPILWAILLIVLSSLIRPLWLWMLNPGWMPELDFILKQVKTSILVFFQLQWDTKTLTIVERLLSIPILGTLILALRRKLERRMRH